MSGTSILPHNMGVSNAHKWIAWVTGILTLLLALLAFILSFNALTDLAASHGVSIPPLFPLIVEFAVVIFSLNALYRSLVGERTSIQWILIIGASLLAGTFNVVHANADFISHAMAAMPSLFLLLSFESFLSLVRYSVTRHEAIATLSELTTRIEVKQVEVDRLAEQIRTSEAELQTLKDDVSKAKKLSVIKMQQARQEKVTVRRQKVLSLLGDGLSEDVIAQELGVSVRTIQRDIAALNGKVR